MRVGELSRRLLLVRGLWDEVQARPEVMGPLPPLRDAFDLLEHAQTENLEAVQQLLLHPTIGSWLGHTMRRLGDVENVESNETPLWVGVGYIHSIAAVAAFQSGIDYTARLPMRNGSVALPTLGLAQLPSQSAWDVAEVRVTNGSLQVSNGETAVNIPAQPGDDAPGWEGAQWYQFQAEGLDGKELSWKVLLDYLDPYRGLREPEAPMRLDATTVERWRAKAEGAWALLVRDHPQQARQIAGLSGILSVVPSSPYKKEPFQPYSASSGDGIGSATLSEPDDPTQMAVTLVHELFHSKLNNLQYMVRMRQPSKGDSELLYAPWRDDPRPPIGLLHGVYAFSAVARFWRERQKIDTGAAADLAAFEFALWREQVHKSALVLRSTPYELTELGDNFVKHLIADIEPWLSEPVPLNAQQEALVMAMDHRKLWGDHHERPPGQILDRAAAAWLAGSPVPPELFEGPQELVKDPTARWLDRTAVLFRLALVNPDVLGDPSQLPEGTTAAEIELAASLLNRDTTSSSSLLNPQTNLGPAMDPILGNGLRVNYSILAELHNRVSTVSRKSVSLPDMARWMREGMLEHLISYDPGRQGNRTLPPASWMLTAEREIRHILKRAEEGYLTAELAAQLIIAQGYLAIGTARSNEIYIPRITISNFSEMSEEGPKHPKAANERQDAVPIVRAGKVAATALWAAFVDDTDDPLQRLRIRPFALPESVYNAGNNGWVFHPQKRKYILFGHRALISAAKDEGLSPDTIIGAMDFVRHDGSFTEIPDEPGHFGSPQEQRTTGTVPVRIGDVHERLPEVLTYDYKPLHR